MRFTATRRALVAAIIAGLWGGVAQAGTTITVAAFPALDAAVKAAIPLYKKQHPDVDIKLVSLAFADHHVAMTTSLATGPPSGTSS